MEASLAIAPINFMTDLAGDPIDRLPTSAKARLRSLRDLVSERRAALEASMDAYDQAFAAKQAAENRVQELKGGPYEKPKCADDHPSMVETVQRLARANEELVRISEQRDARSHRWRTVNGPLSAAEEYLRRLTDRTILSFNGKAAQPRKGESNSEAIDRLRNEIREIGANIHAVRSAPRFASHAKAMMRAEIDRLAEHGKPDVFGMIEHGDDIQWPKRHLRVDVESLALTNGLPARSLGFLELPETVGFIVWLNRDALIAKLDALLDEAADDENALTDTDRAKKLKELSEKLLSIERAECDLIAIDKGEVDHRSDVDPRALLGLSSDMPARREHY